jgi:hypothetical protein
MAVQNAPACESQVFTCGKLWSHAIYMLQHAFSRVLPCVTCNHMFSSWTISVRVENSALGFLTTWESCGSASTCLNMIWGKTVGKIKTVKSVAFFKIWNVRNVFHMHVQGIDGHLASRRVLKLKSVVIKSTWIISQPSPGLTWSWLWLAIDWYHTRLAILGWL